MTGRDLTLTIRSDDLVTFLEATLPDGPGYGRRNIDEQVNISDIHGTPIIAAGQPSPGRGSIVAALAETAMTLETYICDGLEQEPTSANLFWGSRFGIISAAETHEESTTLTLGETGSVYTQLADAIRLGPRAPYANTAEIRVKQRVLNNIAPDVVEPKRRAALDELVRLTAQPMPEISSHLAAGDVRFMVFSIKLFSLDGVVEQDLFWIDTPAGILVPTATGGLLVRARLAIMPPWAAWQNILERLPSVQDIALWHDLAEETAPHRVAFDPSV